MFENTRKLKEELKQTNQLVSEYFERSNEFKELNDNLREENKNLKMQVTELQDQVEPLKSQITSKDNIILRLKGKIKKMELLNVKPDHEIEEMEQSEEDRTDRELKEKEERQKRREEQFELLRKKVKVLRNDSVSLKQASRMLKMSRVTIWRYIKAGKLITVLDGERITKESIMNLMKRMKQAS